MKYSVEFTDEAERDMLRLKKNEQSAYSRLIKLILELKEHPTTGTGKPEQLSGNRSGQWSRRITKKHRLIYKIFDDKVMVFVISAFGHYGDK